MLARPCQAARLSARPTRVPRLRRPTSNSSSATTARTQPARASRLAPYLAELRQKYPHAEPRSLVVAFVVLHELTALVPLAILFGAFHYLGAGAALVAWIVDETTTKSASDSEEAGGTDAADKGWKATVRNWLQEAEAKAERVGRRYGLFGWSKETKEEREERKRVGKEEEEEGTTARPLAKERLLVSGDVANAAAAYLVVKALLPLRILVSLRLSPFLANRVIGRFRAWRTRGATAPIRGPGSSP
ncbi:hypothetical protein JCM10908_005614 [Rhodotorula pacifica]|uniref:uncharacterized protein n=1 Tax=Rhodotorula pacifica TaxID=1495444 RepID=UPI003172C104